MQQCPCECNHFCTTSCKAIGLNIVCDDSCGCNRGVFESFAAGQIQEQSQLEQQDQLNPEQSQLEQEEQTQFEQEEQSQLEQEEQAQFEQEEQSQLEQQEQLNAEQSQLEQEEQLLLKDEKLNSRVDVSEDSINSIEEEIITNLISESKVNQKEDSIISTSMAAMVLGDAPPIDPYQNMLQAAYDESEE